MNMISNGAFRTEMDSSNKQNDLVSKLVSAWEKKNSKVARAGGVSLMALSLAACGDEDSTPFSQADVDAAAAAATTAALTGADGTVYASVDAAVTAGVASVDITSDNAAVIAAATETKDAQIASIQAQLDALTTPVSLATTTASDTLSGTSGNDTITATQETIEAADIIVDNSSTDSDTINISATDDLLRVMRLLLLESKTSITQFRVCNGRWYSYSL